MRLAATLLCLTVCLNSTATADDRPPNVVVIFIDDMGYEDIGPFGAEGIETPHLDKMAENGRRFTDFVVSSAVCSASRAALMTGCYHRRVGISGALGPHARTGINPDEVTLAELCKQKGYATAIFGKWHLGLQKKFLPLQHGFDEYLGLPYSNDMWPYHPNVMHLPMKERLKRWPDLPLIEGNEIINPKVTPKDQEQLTTEYTEHAVDFIHRNKENPFFLYVPHSMVHVPLYVSEKFKGKSSRGLFGDVVMEVDWSVGQINAALQEEGLDDNTLVIFTSDNGPWLSYGDHAGTTQLREGKGTMFEGGYREPTLMQWTGKIPAGTSCDQLASTIDILPTVAALIGADLPEHPIDGKDIRPLIFGDPGAKSPHEAFYCYYGGGELRAIRNDRWKLHFPHSYRTLAGREGGSGGTPSRYEQAKIGRALFDLDNDVNETNNVIDDHPEIVELLEKHAEAARADLGDRLTKRKGSGIRPAGKM
ncbi:sulfatase family protein [Allorhodopirellula solitaria]|uniref:Arylsulfatase n=1 Tax=Allorhodopirellula solitaria TaxID=2527987 RepID=A0A5C5YJJ1_9BACT|nr:sulfatase [Allorhodopirellula solitaria]TWT75066.1 Arylsulfatase [Allorhodopirellula solitaria]